MVYNRPLQEVVLRAMYKHLTEKNPSLRDLSDGDEDAGVQLLERETQLETDTPHKVKVHCGGLVGYGYDFEEANGEGLPTRDYYLEKVRQTGAMSDMKYMEKLLADGIVDGRFGWYLAA